MAHILENKTGYNGETFCFLFRERENRNWNDLKY